MEQQQTQLKIPIRTANERIAAGLLQPDLNSLLGDVWQTGELATFFGGTGTGKSILGVQIANDLSRGESIDNEYLKNECSPQVVLYLDFELSDKQFQTRYTSDDETKSTYQFSDNLKFMNISFGEIYDPKVNTTETIFTLINEAINESKARILIIDNITALSSQDNSDGNSAMEIMAYLDKLKRNCSISILVIAHTPKKNKYSPIDIGSLAGSSKIANFSDCVFAIGQSIKSSEYRYLIQTKFSRSKKAAFDTSNVLTLEILKESNFIKFQVKGTTIEKEHLQPDGDELKLQAISLKNSKHMTVRAIADQLNVSKSTVSLWTKNTP